MSGVNDLLGVIRRSDAKAVGDLLAANPEGASCASDRGRPSDQHWSAPGKRDATPLKGGSVFKRIDHVEIVTAHLDRSVQFYTDVLGFRIQARDRIDRSSLGVPLNLVYLELGGTSIQRMAYHGASDTPGPAPR